jgi:hypothetical protein
VKTQMPIDVKSRFGERFRVHYEESPTLGDPGSVGLDGHGWPFRFGMESRMVTEKGRPKFVTPGPMSSGNANLDNLARRERQEAASCQRKQATPRTPKPNRRRRLTCDV